MADLAELRTLVKQLQGATAPEEIRDILQVLKKEARITESALRESKAGLAVGKLRQHASKEVSDIAKELVKQWKAIVDKEKAARGDGAKAGAKEAAAPAAAAKKSTPTASKSVTPAPSAPAATPATTKPKPAPPVRPPAGPSASSAPSGGASDKRTMKNDGNNMTVTGDKTRDKCVELIYDSLVIDTAAPSDLILKRATAVEAAVLAANPGLSAAYKQQIRTLMLNLKDPKNPGLRESVISGDLPAAKFAVMSSAEMASEERKAADRKIEDSNLFTSLAAGEQQAETDAFQCGRCKQRKCRYRQAQTRSADEPMTTFVTCTNCGHRWKFS